MTPARTLLRSVACGVALVVGSEATATAQAPAPDASTAEVERCVQAHDNARALMLAEKWLEARAAMERCRESSCPLAVRSDCDAWLDEIARVLPTLIVVVEREDDGTRPATLEIDGQTVDLPVPPRPIEVLPGTHLVRVSLAPHPPVERVVSLAKGEKNHLVRVRFVSEATAPAPLPPAAPPPPRASRPIPPLTYAIGAGALAALSVSGAMLGSALIARDEALETCAPVCDPSEGKSIDARLLAADIFGGVGLVLGGFTVYTFLNRPVRMEAPVALTPRFDLGPNGSALSLEGRF